MAVAHPEYHVRGEIRKILAGSAPVEAVLRVKGRKYDPERPETFLHLRVRLRGRRARFRPGEPVAGLVLMTTRWLEESERPARTLEVDGRRGSGRIPRAIRVVGHDTRVAGRVLRDLGRDRFVLDAGIPVLVRTPDFPPGAHREGADVEFLLVEPVEFRVA